MGNCSLRGRVEGGFQDDGERKISYCARGGREGFRKGRIFGGEVV